MAKNLSKEQKRLALLIGTLTDIQNTNVQEKVQGYVR